MEGLIVIDWMFWGSLLFVCHTYAGYPAWLALRSRWATRAPRRDPAYAPSVAVIVVGHNVAERIAAKIDSCLAQTYRGPLHVLVASDGSTDATGEVVERHPDPRVRALVFPVRRGKAACLNDAAAGCDADIIVFTDARQRLHAEAVERLVAVLADPAFGAVSGELVFEKDDATLFGEGVDAYWRYEKFIRRLEAQQDSVIGVTGALYAIRRECFRPIPESTILDDVAIPMQVVMQGLRVGFEAGAIAYDKPSRDVAQERVRKIRTLSGNYQVLTLVPRLLSPWHNRLLANYFWHKLARLLAPLALLLCLGANAVLAARGPGVYDLLLVLQAAFYGLAWAGSVAAIARRLRLARLAHAFVTLNVFALLGLLQFLRQRRGQGHLWAMAEPAADARRLPS